MADTRTRDAIVHLFNKFQASSTMGREDLASKIRDYCETMDGCTPKDVETACRQLARVDSPYIPSAGQIYCAAQRAAANRVARAKAETPRLPSPPRGADAYPPEHRAEMQRQWQELIAEIKSNNATPDRREKISAEAETKAALDALARYQAGERKPQPVFLSPALQAQLRGEMPIGQGKLGARPVGDPVEYREAV